MSFGLCLVCRLALLATPTPVTPDPEVHGVEAFNEKFRDAALRMDVPASMELWDENGVFLAPGSLPIVGRKAYGLSMASGFARMPDFKVTSMEEQFRDIQVSGDWASEWGLTRQVIEAPRKPTIILKGKILLVLHRGQDGQWRVMEESWTQE